MESHLAVASSFQKTVGNSHVMRLLHAGYYKLPAMGDRWAGLTHIKRQESKVYSRNIDGRRVIQAADVL